jgi:hypothetical protein
MLFARYNARRSNCQFFVVCNVHLREIVGHIYDVGGALAAQCKPNACGPTLMVEGRLLAPLRASMVQDNGDDAGCHNPD